MSVRRAVARGAVSMGAGQVAAQGLSMAKNVVLARLLGPEDWGVATTFWVTLTLLESISTLAADRQIVQAENGSESQFFATAHALQMVRGVVIGLLMLGLSWTSAWMFDTWHALWAYQVMAAAPVLRGLSHLGMYVGQREMRFGATIRVDLWTQIIGLSLAVWLAMTTRSYAAALWVIVGQSAATCVLSHVVGGSGYRWAWDSAAALRIWRFGLPLTVNGALMFVIMQGDQAVIGIGYDKATLGQYAAAFGLASIPTMLLSKVASVVLLPPLARAQQNREVFTRRVGGAMELMAIFAGMVGVGALLLGPRAVELLYGEAYAPGGEVVGLLGVMFAIRLYRTAHSLTAMALGDTVNAMLANVYRMMALPAVLVAGVLGMDVWWIALSGVAGEILALHASAMRLQRRGHAAMRLTLLPAVLAGAPVVAASGLTMHRGIMSSHIVAALATCVMGAGVVALLTWGGPRTRASLSELAGMWEGRRARHRGRV